MSSFTNKREFISSFNSVFTEFERANNRAAEYYREKTYEFMQKEMSMAYSKNTSSGSYKRTYALIDALQATYGYTQNGSGFTLFWNNSLHTYEPKSVWGGRSVSGTHRTFFGSSTYSLSVGDKVQTPIILNEMKRNSITKRNNHFNGFIDKTKSYVRSRLLSNHKQHLMDFFEL